MKVALSWLSKYLDLPESVPELADLLTFAGIEVEGITTLAALPASVIAARVVSAEPVPKTDHLQLCKVDIGAYDLPAKDSDNTVQVICGAPNCQAGMMAVLALPGSILGDMEIKTAKIRGIVSHGMLCSERELGISETHAGIIKLPETTAIGTTANELYTLPDTIFELEITPNRSDLLGYMGIARDLAAKLKRPFLSMEHPDLPYCEDGPKLNLRNQEPELCPRYTARVIRNVKVAESPLWLKSALIKSGLRPINNIVDITNFVMLESGHPLHAFDYDTLAAIDSNSTCPDIVIRRAHPQEEMLALDARKYILEGDELVIADGHKASAIAGVMGSEYSGVSDQTSTIVLECAAFHPGSIRKTSYKLKLSSDSSYRFERHLASEFAEAISARATGLILDLAGGEAISPLWDSYPRPEPEQYLAVRPARFTQLIGFSLSDEDIQGYLLQLGFVFKGYGRFCPGLQSSLTVVNEERDSALSSSAAAHFYTVPAFRKDISREADMVEELARLAGYDKVPQKTAPQQIMDRHAYRIRKQATEWLVNWSCFETLNYSFSDPRQMQDLGYDLADLPLISLLNPQSSAYSVMRVSLVPQLLSNLAYNLNHAKRNIKLFEQAKVYHKTAQGHNEPMQLAAVFSGTRAPQHWQGKPMAVDFSWVKGCFEGLLEMLKLSCEILPSQRPYHIAEESFCYTIGKVELGTFGRVKPQVLAAWGIDTNLLKQEVWVLEYDLDALVSQTRLQSVTYVPIPRFPAVTRDLSFLAPESLLYSELKMAMMQTDFELVREVQVFDEYRSQQIPEGFRSLSLHIVLQDQEKTLTDERVEQVMASVQKVLIEKYQIRMR